MNKNFVVLGGGTAGWFTALFLRKLFPTSNVTMIQGESVGIIGVGEGTVPNIIPFLQSIDIDPLDLITNTKGSIKNGISFENWNGDGKKYFHAFKDSICDFYIPNVFGTGCEDYYLKHLIKEKLPFDEYQYATKLAYSNKVDLDRQKYALHFDARLISEYLEKVGKQRNISIITGDYTNCDVNEVGNIKTINLKNNQSVNCDFVFDCSGFARLLIGKHFKDKWISYSDHLPMKKGMPFWLESEDEIQPYTSAIAMQSGWMWKIPLQHRIGAGYIFDSDFINEDQAINEAEIFFGQKIKVNKIIPFDAGRFEHVWIKNCMAVGLSSSFIEPLEATSLFLTIQQLETFKQFLNEIDSPKKSSIKLFNEIIGNNMDDTLSFVYLHYITKRTDSEFWKNFKKNYTVPKKLKDKLELIKENNLRYFDTSDIKTTGNFNQYSYLQIINGLDLFENEINLQGYETVVPNPLEYKELMNKLLIHAPNHKIFLKQLSRDIQI